MIWLLSMASPIPQAVIIVIISSIITVYLAQKTDDTKKVESTLRKQMESYFPFFSKIPKNGWFILTILAGLWLCVMILATVPPALLVLDALFFLFTVFMYWLSGKNHWYNQWVKTRTALFLVTAFVSVVLHLALFSIVVLGTAICPYNHPKYYHTISKPDYFPKDIPATAYDIDVHQHNPFLQGSGDVQLSFSADSEMINEYRKQAEDKAKYVLQIKNHQVMNGDKPFPYHVFPGYYQITDDIDESTQSVYMQYFLYGHVTYKEHIDPSFPPNYTIYLFDHNTNDNHPHSKGIAISPNSTRIIFFEQY